MRRIDEINCLLKRIRLNEWEDADIGLFNDLYSNLLSSTNIVANLKLIDHGSPEIVEVGFDDERFEVNLIHDLQQAYVVKHVYTDKNGEKHIDIFISGLESFFTSQYLLDRIRLNSNFLFIKRP